MPHEHTCDECHSYGYDGDVTHCLCNSHFDEAIEEARTEGFDEGKKEGYDEGYEAARVQFET